MGLLGTATAVADVPFEQLRPFLTEERCRALLGDPADVSVDVDGATVGMQGQFWYRGEYTFTPYGENGTEVTYRIRNVSGRPDAVIRLWQRKMLKDQQRAVEAYAAELPGRVG
ncbi:hypothetical protein [Kribbella sp.]|uniref:hypothetical protein n=1 Tax=Kribbella sp. TaxID=1871183 RepID=UPI002D622B47|nr:hypothetical protein [Kribbella sp.]HZX05317.1 hypothetical protein [Kribbella sp.]